MNRKLLSKIVSLSLLFLFFFPAFLFAEDFRIENIVVTGDENRILCSSLLKGDIDNDILEPIKSGIPITFTYYIELFKRRTAWMDSKVVSKTIKKTVDYNHLTKEYKLVQVINQHTQRSLSKDIDEARQWIKSLDRIPVATYDELEYDRTYYLKIKAELKSIKIVFPLNYVLFFFSFFDKETSWHESPLFVVKESLQKP